MLTFGIKAYRVIDVSQHSRVTELRYVYRTRDRAEVLPHMLN